MLNSILFMFFYIMILSCFMFIKSYKYIMMMLISLEFIVVSLILLMFYYLNKDMNWFIMIYMIISVCDGVIGLSLMINMVNYYGNQNLKNLSLLWY